MWSPLTERERLLFEAWITRSWVLGLISTLHIWFYQNISFLLNFRQPVIFWDTLALKSNGKSRASKSYSWNMSSMNGSRDPVLSSCEYLSIFCITLVAIYSPAWVERYLCLPLGYRLWDGTFHSLQHFYLWFHLMTICISLMHRFHCILHHSPSHNRQMLQNVQRIKNWHV